MFTFRDTHPLQRPNLRHRDLDPHEQAMIHESTDEERDAQEEALTYGLALLVLLVGSVVLWWVFL